MNRNTYLTRIIIPMLSLWWASQSLAQVQLIERWELLNTNINPSQFAVSGIGNDGTCMLSSYFLNPTNYTTDWHWLWLDAQGNVIRTFTTNDFPGFSDGYLLSVSSNAVVFWNQGTNLYNQPQMPTNTYIAVYTNAASPRLEFAFPNELNISTFLVSTVGYNPHPNSLPTDFLVTRKGSKLVCYRVAGLSSPSALTIQLANGTASIMTSGVTGQTVSLQSSANTVDWATLSTVTNAPEAVQWQTKTAASTQLYRTFSPP